MEQTQIMEILTKLRNRETEEFLIKKEEFMAFRDILVKQEDFKQFRGVAQQGGDVIYTYLDMPRS